MTGDNLLRAICARPADDQPRLVYADWLADHADEVRCDKCNGTGSWRMPMFSHIDPCNACDGTGRRSNRFAERSEFIRVQIDLANTECPGCRAYVPCSEGGLCRRRHLKERSDFLLQSPSQGDYGLPLWGLWAGPVLIATNHRGAFYTDAFQFQRGFIFWIKLPIQSFINYAATIFSQHPVTSVLIADRRPVQHGQHPTGGYGLHEYAWSQEVDDHLHPNHRHHGRAIDQNIENGTIPLELFKAGLPLTRFSNPDAAMLALSAAAIAHGRTLVGLPPLEAR